MGTRFSRNWEVEDVFMETGVWMITPRAYNCEYILMASIERIVNKDLEVVTGMVGQKHATTCKHAQKDPTFS